MSEPVRHGVLPRPRVALVGDSAREHAEEVRKLAGHVWVAKNARELDRMVSPAEVDVAIAFGPQPALLWKPFAERAHSVAFVKADQELAVTAKATLYRRVCARREFVCTVGEDELVTLTRRSVRKLKSARGLLRWGRHQNAGTSRCLKRPHRAIHLLSTDEPGDIALYSRGRGNNFLILPEKLCETVHHAEWIGAAFRMWKEDDPKRFASVPSHEEDARWHTREELAATAALDELEQRKRELFDELQRERERLVAEREAARRTADAGPRALLTASGEALVTAASAALEQLGLRVTVPESEHGPHKLEDLLIEHDSWADWSASVEVKGFEGSSARSTHVTTLGRRRDRRGTTAAILIVNGQCAKSAARRDPLFSDNAESIDNCVAAEVLVVDTRDLFRAVYGDGDREALIAALRDGLGVYKGEVPTKWRRELVDEDAL